MSTCFSILAKRTQWTVWKGKEIWHQEMSSPGQKVSTMVLEKSGGQSLTVPERMKWPGQSRSDAHVQMCLVVKLKSKEQYCIGTWNVRSINQGKLDKVKQDMARLNINILQINKLKWIGMGHFNSDDQYICYCGQESIRIME